MTRPIPQAGGRPPGFLYRKVNRARSADTVLHCEHSPLTLLAERFGTPLYVYSTAAIRDHVQAFERVFHQVPHTLCYSVKANSNLGVLRLLATMNCGFDVVSGGELNRVLKVSRSAARKTVFSGVGKTETEMEDGLAANILLFNVESESELSALAKCAGRLKKTARIALRVNPDVSAETHPYISTGLREHKFGVPIADAVRLYSKAATDHRLRVAGVSVHIGSQIVDVKPFAQTMERVADLIRELRAEGHTITYVDAGGGLGIDYEHGVSDFSTRVAAYAQAVLTPLRGLKVHLLLEPGRSIVGPAGILLIRVLYRKTNHGKKFLVVDAAMNDFLRPALYGAYHQIVPIKAGSDSTQETVDIVGPVCETGDFLARDRELPVMQEGDLLAVLDAGAYGMALASNYNTRPRPAEVLVNGKRVKLVRRRESIADLLRLEKAK
ncbi:Diaminopimelate decarboxylase [Candidatus Sulfotelmatobacter sp. SbA7]|nr:Diaminopimelate decarboxylase [Candidatus Sulfotelmatobacter sp. SbA7]